MDLDPNALQNASEALFDRLGPLDDLRPDLANTIADIYYKFHVMALEPGIPVAVFEAPDPAKLVSERFRISHFYRTVDQLIESIRGHAGEQRRLGEELALDILKYRIDNAEKKNGVRLAIERKFKAVNEISGIYGALKASRETRRFRAQPNKAPEGTGDRSRNFLVTKVSESVAGRPTLHIEPAPLSTDGIPELSDELAELIKPYLKATDNIALRFIDDGLPT